MKLYQRSNDIDELANNLGCHVSSLPVTIWVYLWELISRQSIFGIPFWRDCRSDCLARRIIFFLDK
jgi:hypothetical protein